MAPGIKSKNLQWLSETLPSVEQEPPLAPAPSGSSGFYAPAPTDLGPALAPTPAPPQDPYRDLLSQAGPEGELSDRAIMEAQARDRRSSASDDLYNNVKAAWWAAGGLGQPPRASTPSSAADLVARRGALMQRFGLQQGADAQEQARRKQAMESEQLGRMRDPNSPESQRYRDLYESIRSTLRGAGANVPQAGPDASAEQLAPLIEPYLKLTLGQGELAFKGAQLAATGQERGQKEQQDYLKATSVPGLQWTGVPGGPVPPAATLASIADDANSLPAMNAAAQAVKDAYANYERVFGLNMDTKEAYEALHRAHEGLVGIVMTQSKMRQNESAAKLARARIPELEALEIGHPTPETLHHVGRKVDAYMEQQRAEARAAAEAAGFKVLPGGPFAAGTRVRMNPPR